MEIPYVGVVVRRSGVECRSPLGEGAADEGVLELLEVGRVSWFELQV